MSRMNWREKGEASDSLPLGVVSVSSVFVFFMIFPWWTCKLSEIECMSIIVLTFAGVNGFAVASVAVRLESRTFDFLSDPC